MGSEHASVPGCWFERSEGVGIWVPQHDAAYSIADPHGNQFLDEPESSGIAVDRGGFVNDRGGCNIQKRDNGLVNQRIIGFCVLGVRRCPARRGNHAADMRRYPFADPGRVDTPKVHWVAPRSQLNESAVSYTNRRPGLRDTQWHLPLGAIAAPGFDELTVDKDEHRCVFFDWKCRDRGHLIASIVCGGWSAICDWRCGRQAPYPGVVDTDNVGRGTARREGQHHDSRRAGEVATE